MHFLITAGPTREYLDPVRFISNGSTGKMGYACAAAAIKRGHKVTLVSGPVWTPGTIGGALVFDGVDDYVNVPNSPTLEPTVTTLAGWIRIDGDGSHDDGVYFLSKGRLRSSHVYYYRATFYRF